MNEQRSAIKRKHVIFISHVSIVKVQGNTEITFRVVSNLNQKSKSQQHSNSQCSSMLVPTTVL